MNYKTQGFGLIETIFGIVILATALTASALIINSATAQVRTNNQRIQGIYLAQQRLETARNLRDSAWKESKPWDCAFAPSQYNIRQCQGITPLQQAFTSSVDPRLQQRFDFNITNQKVRGNRLAEEITCQVFWDTETIELTQILTHWNQR